MNKITTKEQEPKVKETKTETIEGTKADDVAELKKVEETANTVKLEKANGEQVDVDKAELETPEEITSCADHISRTKILDVIESTMARYNGKVVLAMSEVRDIIKAITTAVKE